MTDWSQVKFRDSGMRGVWTYVMLHCNVIRDLCRPNAPRNGSRAAESKHRMSKPYTLLMSLRDDHGNGIPSGNGISSRNGNPMGMETDDKIGNGNGKEWETTCMGMGMGINSHRRLVLMTILFCIENNS